MGEYTIEEKLAVLEQMQSVGILTFTEGHIPHMYRVLEHEQYISFGLADEDDIYRVANLTQKGRELIRIEKARWNHDRP